MASQSFSLAAILLTTVSISQAMGSEWPLAPSSFQTGRQNPQTPSQWTMNELHDITPHQMIQEHDASELSKQLEINADNFLAGQRLALMQLEQTGVSAQGGALGDQWPRSSSSLIESPPVAQGHLVKRRSAGTFLEAQNPSAGPAKTALALQQAKVEEKRQRNPALAALLLEPALQLYTLCVWAICLLLTGLSSACCVYHGKLPYQRPRDPAQRPFFTYPSGILSKFRGRRAAQDTAAASASDATQATQEAQTARSTLQADADRVETWTKVPLHQASRMSAGEDWPGYLDDSDEENTAYGYVDEN